MTKSLKTLVKLAKQELDAKRRELNIFLDKKDELLGKNVALEQQLAKEAQAIKDQGGYNPTFHVFAAKIAWDQEKNIKAVEYLDVQIDALSKQIEEHFIDMKKYELLIEKKEKEEKDIQDLKNQKDIDEIALQKFAKQE